MIRELEVFETRDGKRFDNKATAEEHVLNSLREILDARLEKLQVAGKLFALDRYRVVLALMPDLAAATNLSALMARWVDF